MLSTNNLRVETWQKRRRGSSMIKYARCVEYAVMSARLPMEDAQSWHSRPTRIRFWFEKDDHQESIFASSFITIPTRTTPESTITTTA